jgi:hypothetical protein
MKLLTSSLGAICQSLTYVIQSPAPPFPIMILANVLAGFGMALQVRSPYRARPVLTLWSS